MKYLTVINKRTGKSVPFLFMENGEIIIKSTDPADDEETCQVVIGDVFHEHSLDFGVMYKRV